MKIIELLGGLLIYTGFIMGFNLDLKTSLAILFLWVGIGILLESVIKRIK